MEAPISLTDYIKQRQQREQKVVAFRQPRWIERMQAKGLPPQDMTSYIRRPGPDAA